MAQEDILIRIRAIDEASRTIRKVSGSLQQLSAPMEKMTVGMGKVQKTIVRTYKPAIGGFQSMEEATNAAGLSTKKWESYARTNFLVQAKGGGIVDKLTGKTISYGQAAKDATMQSRRFKFEWLSIMFAGMALDRAFGSLVKSQMELFGVSGLMADAWTITLLPVMELITPLLFKMIEAFMEMPEWLQIATGGFVLFGAAAGKILTLVGQFVLAKMGFQLLGVGTAATTAAGKVGGLMTKLKLLSGVVLVGISIALIFTAMKEEDAATALAKIFGGALGIAFAALIFGVALVPAIAIGAIVALIALTIKFNFDPKWREAVDDFFRGIKERIENWVNVIKGFGLVKGLKILGQKEPDAIYSLTHGVAVPSEFELGKFKYGGAGGGAGAGAGEGINVSPTYNITVSDKSEMERIMKDNNQSLVEDIKRRIAP